MAVAVEVEWNWEAKTSFVPVCIYGTKLLYLCDHEMGDLKYFEEVYSTNQVLRNFRFGIGGNVARRL